MGICIFIYFILGFCKIIVQTLTILEQNTWQVEQFETKARRSLCGVTRQGIRTPLEFSEMCISVTARPRAVQVRARNDAFSPKTKMSVEQIYSSSPCRSSGNKV